MQTKNLVTKDGISLMHRKIAGEERGQRVAFVTHSQAQHSLNLRDTLQGIASHGWTVHATDLRGHGYSSSDRAPLAHMEMDGGWERLVADLRLGLELAFADTTWEDRMVVAPNIGGPLILEVLKSWPDLARHIVFITPPPNQPTLLKLARTFVKARSKLHAPDKPDELTMHQLYSFLGARLSDRKRLIDVVSSDRTITDALLDDPYAWPTPTTGYFHEMFRGIESAWRWPNGDEVANGTRMLILYGGDDPMTANGKFVGPMRRHFQSMGIDDVSSHCFEKGRSGLFIEEKRLGISAVIERWATGGDMPQREVATGDMADISSGVLEQLGFDNFDGELSAEALVELCYNAIDDESRWIEMLYRVTYAISSNKELDETNLEGIVLALMPHWDRSYKLNRQVMQSAAIGAVLQNVIERFHIGMAVVSPDMEVTFANSLFAQTFADLTGAIVEADETDLLTKELRAVADPAFLERCRSKSGEALFMLDGEAVGFHFRPKALKQTALQRGGASGVLILRHGSGRATGIGEEKTELLQFAYGLTAKEAEVAVGLIDGLSPDMIAKKSDVSIHTVRTHLKRAYEKVGVQGQTELAARLLKGPVGLIAGT
ncbi:MAG: alpha/beta hydrolase [Pseudomonadota bacterium]